MAAHDASRFRFDGDALVRAAMVGGAFWLAWRVLKGAGGLVWTLVGLAIAARATGVLGG